MELKIKTEAALNIVKLGEMTPSETMAHTKKNHKNAFASIKAIIGHYACELISAAEAINVELDLTYETIKNIPAALALLYNKQHQWGYPDYRNKIVTCKTLAAYIDLLIINNFDDCRIDVKTYSNKNNETRPDMWQDCMLLKLDNKKNSDMLPFIWAGANRAPILMESGFIIDITPLIDGYKQLTGDNIADEGLTNIVLTHQD